MSEPRWKHEGETSVFLGQHEKLDLYFTKKSPPKVSYDVLEIRWGQGSEEWDFIYVYEARRHYGKGLEQSRPALWLAFELAKQKGLIKK